MEVRERFPGQKLQVEQAAWADWKDHQRTCRRGCKHADMEHDRGYCEDGWTLLTFWRVAIHVAEHGGIFDTDDQAAVEKYREVMG